MSIKNVIICGLGALGITYAVKLSNVCNLKILADCSRIERYKKHPPIFNNDSIELNYITPEDSFNADLIIIATKSTGLDSAIEYIKNFITPNTKLQPLPFDSVNLNATAHLPYVGLRNR
jgi:2-dehydropantoate 2-reductase